MFRADDQTLCNIHPAPGYTHHHYSLLLCDLARHIANAFNVPESELWRGIDAERANPTTKIEQGFASVDKDGNVTPIDEAGHA
jgi:hypothetical protein